MEGLKIVHCADIHLDSAFCGLRFSPEDARARAADLKKTFENITNLARAEQADVLLIAGDLFEAKTTSKQTALRAIELFEKLGEIQVLIAPGNHDPFTGDSYYALLNWPPNVTIFGPEWRAVEVKGRKAFVHGWGFPNPHVTERRLKELRVAHPDALNVVLMHGSDDAVPSGEQYLPFSRDDCLACGADYIALGHFHAYRVVGGRAGIFAAYPGAPESLDFAQGQPHGVLVGTVSKEGNSLELRQMGLREHRTLRLDVTGAQTPESIREKLLAAIPAEERKRHFFRVLLFGEVEPALELDAASMAKALVGAGEFYYLELENSTRPDYDLDALARENTLRGRFVTRLKSELSKASDDQTRRQIELALRLGLRALERGGRV